MPLAPLRWAPHGPDRETALKCQLPRGTPLLPGLIHGAIAWVMRGPWVPHPTTHTVATVLQDQFEHTYTLPSDCRHPAVGLTPEEPPSDLTEGVRHDSPRWCRGLGNGRLSCWGWEARSPHGAAQPESIRPTLRYRPGACRPRRNARQWPGRRRAPNPAPPTG